ncbi:MAG: transcriptional regulator [Saprospiraceae bacterium]|nr:MAG: transcriptional regulator [Saprospiraceae bacterium]
MYEHTDIALNIDHSSKIPLYLQVESLLRKIIALPKYQNGELLPNEINLSNRLGVSRSTTRQAINNLVNDGLVERKKGVGTRVSKRPTISRLDNWLSFTREMNAKGLKVINYDLQIQEELASTEVAKALKIKEGRRIIKLHRLRGTEAKPAVVTTSWFHPRIDLELDEDFSQPLYELLDKKYNTVVQYSQEEIRAEKADRLLAEQLNVEIGDPILSRYRIVSDQGRRLVEFNKTYYRADSFTYFIELQRI